MAQSTEDYLDSLLRQAMGVPDPEPQPVVPAPDPEREDILAAIDGLTGSNSAILGNAYDENASFTNEGEIEIPTETPVSAEPDTASVEIPEPEILQDMLPDVDAPVASEVMPEDHVVIPEENAIAPEEPVIIQEQEIVIPDEPVIEPDGNLDILPEPEVEVPVIEEPVIEKPVAEEPIVEEPAIEEPAIEEPIIEEPIIEEPITKHSMPI